MSELPSIHANEVNGLDCPACGHPTLMLMAGGYITCCLLDCPNPDYADAIQAYISKRVEEALVKLLAEHDAACGATFAENPRDDCTLRQQIFDRLAQLSKEK